MLLKNFAVWHTTMEEHVRKTAITPANTIWRESSLCHSSLRRRHVKPAGANASEAADDVRLASGESFLGDKCEPVSLTLCSVSAFTLRKNIIVADQNWEDQLFETTTYVREAGTAALNGTDGGLQYWGGLANEVVTRVNTSNVAALGLMQAYLDAKPFSRLVLIRNRKRWRYRARADYCKDSKQR